MTAEPVAEKPPRGRAVRVLIYTKDQCQACRLTKIAFDDAHMPYTEHDITNDPAMQANLRAAGHLEMPVVVTNYEVWTGFRPAKIKGAIHGKTR